MRAARLTVLFLLVAAFVASPALGKNDGFKAHIFQPSTDGFGVHSVGGAETLRPFTFHGGATYSYARNVVEFGSPGDSRDASVVDRLSALDLVLGVGLPKGFSVGVALPLGLYTFGHELDNDTESPAEARLDRTGPMDMRLEGKWQFYRADDDDFMASVTVFGTVPMGKTAREFRTDDGQINLGAKLNAEWQWWRVRVLAEVGYRWLEEDIEIGGIHVDDSILFGVGTQISIWRQIGKHAVDRREDHLRQRKELPDDVYPVDVEVVDWGLSFELSVNGSFRVSHPSDELTLPLEVHTGLLLDMPHQSWFNVGVSAGLDNGVGAPDYRLFAGFGVTVGGRRHYRYDRPLRIYDELLGDPQGNWGRPESHDNPGDDRWKKSRRPQTPTSDATPRTAAPRSSAAKAPAGSAAPATATTPGKVPMGADAATEPAAVDTEGLRKDEVPVTRGAEPEPPPGVVAPAPEKRGTDALDRSLGDR